MARRMLHLPHVKVTPEHPKSAGVQRRLAMAQLEDTREAERGGDALATSEDYAARLAALVFERRLARAGKAAPPSSELWMSRSTRRSSAKR